MSFWDKVSSLYDLAETVNRTTNTGISIAVERTVPKGAYVLDCAAGTGMLTLAAAKKARHVVSTDLSKKMLVQSLKKARRRGFFNISFARRNITALKDADEKYDVVMAGNVLHLLDDPAKAFSELVRVTKKGGKIIIPTYLQGEKGLLFTLLIKLYSLIGFSHKNDFTLDSYMKFVSENAEACGCSEYSTELIMGNLPAGFAVITK